MRRAAQYNGQNAAQLNQAGTWGGPGAGDAGAPPIPNLPGHTYFANTLAQTAAQLGARKPRHATLRFEKGYPIVEDHLVSLGWVVEGRLLSSEVPCNMRAAPGLPPEAFPPLPWRSPTITRSNR